MNEDDILKYIASNDELLQSCNNLFEGQSKIFSGENNYIENFSPYLFIASNITDFFKSEHIDISYNIKLGVFDIHIKKYLVLLIKKFNHAKKN